MIGKLPAPESLGQSFFQLITAIHPVAAAVPERVGERLTCAVARSLTAREQQDQYA